MTALWQQLDDPQHVTIILAVTLVTGLFIAAFTLGLCRMAAREMPPADRDGQDEHRAQADDARADAVADREWDAIRALDWEWER